VISILIFAVLWVFFFVLFWIDLAPETMIEVFMVLGMAGLSTGAALSVIGMMADYLLEVLP
jgi:hypothetical protein